MKKMEFIIGLICENFCEHSFALTSATVSRLISQDKSLRPSFSLSLLISLYASNAFALNPVSFADSASAIASLSR